MHPFIRWSPSRSTRDYGPYPIHIPHLYVCHTPPHIHTSHHTTHPARSSADLSLTSLPLCTNLSKGQASSVASQAQNDPTRTYSCDWTIGGGHSSSLLDTPCPGGLPDILGSSTPCMLVCQVGECFRLQPDRAAGLVTTALVILQTLQCAWQRLVFSKDTRDRVQAGNSIIYWLLRHWSAFRWKGPELLIPTKQGTGGRRARKTSAPGGPSPIPPLSSMEPQCCPPGSQISGIGVAHAGSPETRSAGSCFDTFRLVAADLAADCPDGEMAPVPGADPALGPTTYTARMLLDKSYPANEAPPPAHAGSPETRSAGSGFDTFRLVAADRAADCRARW